jgi:hypothetical protein
VQLTHVIASGADLRQAGLHLSQRLGFTLSRGETDSSLRVVLEQGYLQLEETPAGEWFWQRTALADPSGYLPPQAAMEPERARAVVTHTNTAIGLLGVMQMVPDVAKAVAQYERRLGVRSQQPFSYGSLGVRGQSVPVGAGQFISLVTATADKGPGARLLRESPHDIFAVIVRVASVRTAAETLRKGAVYGFMDDFGRLVTDAALPGYGVMIFEEMA